MIHVRDLQFAYSQSDFRLQISDLRIRQGATVAVTGPSGSGKTTLLNLVSGILVPSSGRITTNNIEVSSASEAVRRSFRVRHIGLVFQDFELLEHLTVLDNILLPCRLTSSLRLSREHRQGAEELAQEMGIADKLRRFVGTLSQGERQRVAICRALVLKPPLVLCDEPTGNLDPVNRDRVLDILFEYVDRHGTTMLAVTHDHQLVPRFQSSVDFATFRQDGKLHA